MAAREAARRPHRAVHRLIEADGRGLRLLAGLRAGEREQVADQAAHALRLGRHVIQHLGALGRFHPLAVLAEQIGVAANRGQRGAQFVRGVRDEAALRVEDRLQPAQHAIEGLPEIRHLVAGARHRDAAGEVLRLLDARRIPRHPPDRPERGLRHDVDDHGEHQVSRAARRPRASNCALRSDRCEWCGRLRGDDGAKSWRASERMRSGIQKRANLLAHRPSRGSEREPAGP